MELAEDGGCEKCELGEWRVGLLMMWVRMWMVLCPEWLSLAAIDHGRWMRLWRVSGRYSGAIVLVGLLMLSAASMSSADGAILDVWRGARNRAWHLLLDNHNHSVLPPLDHHCQRLYSAHLRLFNANITAAAALILALLVCRPS